MALSNPRIFFGVSSFTAYNRDSGLPYGTSLVLANSSFSLSGELVSLTGGSNRYNWAVEESNITAELSITFRQYEDWMMELFLGKAPTAGTPSATGTVGAIANKKGTSVVNASTGIASVAAISGSEADLKFTKYVVKAASATTVDIYAYSNTDFGRGTDKVFENDELKITTSPITVPDSGATVDFTGYGIEITGGSGTVAFTAGDTAVFEVLPADEKSVSAVFGGSTDSFPEFGAVIMGQKRGNGGGEMVEIDVYRCKAVGLPMNFAEKAFSEAEITAQAYYDSEQGGVFKLRHVTPL